MVYIPGINEAIIAAANAYLGGTGIVGSLNGTGATVVVSTPIISLTQTWNAGGVAFDLITANVTNTASANSSNFINFKVGGATNFSVESDGATLFGSVGSTTSSAIGLFNNGLGLGSGATVEWFSSNPGSTRDLKLVRDAANTLALRNAASAQVVNVYNTYTDASNYERAHLGWVGSAFEIQSENAGTGSARKIKVVTAGAQPIELHTSNTLRWSIDSSGHIGAGLDNAYDIGAVATNRPRNIYAAGGLFPVNVQVASAGYLGWGNGTNITSSGSGIFTFNNNGNTNSTTITVGASNLLTFQGGGAFGGNISTSGGIITSIVSQSGTTYSASALDSTVIFTAASTVTLTLPAAGSSTGRTIRLKTTGGGSVISATSNVVPKAGGAAGTAILAAAAGTWAELQSDGSNWIVVAGT